MPGGESPPPSLGLPRPAPRAFFLEGDDSRRAEVLRRLLQRAPVATAYPGRGAAGVPRRFVARPLRSSGPVFGFALSPRSRPPLGRGGMRLTLPLRVEACVRRTQRREALFALRKIGFAGSSPGRRSRFTGKRYRRTGDSNYACV